MNPDKILVVVRVQHFTAIVGLDNHGIAITVLGIAFDDPAFRYSPDRRAGRGRSPGTQSADPILTQFFERPGPSLRQRYR